MGTARVRHRLRRRPRPARTERRSVGASERRSVYSCGSGAGKSEAKRGADGGLCAPRLFAHPARFGLRGLVRTLRQERTCPRGGAVTADAHPEHHATHPTHGSKLPPSPKRGHSSGARKPKGGAFARRAAPEGAGSSAHSKAPGAKSLAGGSGDRNLPSCSSLVTKRARPRT